MSQATIAAGRRMSTARCYLDPIRNRQNLHIETDALTEALVLDGKRCTGVRYSVGGDGARGPARRVRSSSAPARSIRRSCWNCPASASPSGCAIWASRCARRCPASARTCATITRRGRAGTSARRASPSTTGPAVSVWWHQALRYAVFRTRACSASVGGPDARIRLLARRSRGAGPAAGLGADADRTRPKGPRIVPPVRRDLLRAPDAAGEQGAYPHHFGRSAQTAGDQLQLPVVAASTPS